MSLPSFIVCIVIIIVELCSSLVPIIIGSVQKRRALKPLEFYPPAGYSPIDVLIKYYGHTANPRALFNPLMLYWADKNRIAVKEDCKRGFILTKLHDLEPEYSGDDGRKNFAAENKLYASIFADGDVFYTLAAGYRKNKEYDDFAAVVAENAGAMRTPTAKKAATASTVLSVLSLIAIIAVVGAHTGPAIITMIFPCVAIVMLRVFPNEGIFKFFKYFFFLVWGGAPFGAALAISPPDIMVVLLFSTVIAALNVNVLAGRIDLRTQKDLEIYGRLQAFKTFLLQAEIDRLELLLEENPNYYFDILPYCYVFKITKKMKIKFDKINLDGPAWELGDLRDRLMF